MSPEPCCISLMPVSIHAGSGQFVVQTNATRHPRAPAGGNSAAGGGRTRERHVSIGPRRLAIGACGRSSGRFGAGRRRCAEGSGWSWAGGNRDMLWEVTCSCWELARRAQPGARREEHRGLQQPDSSRTALLKHKHRRVQAVPCSRAGTKLPAPAATEWPSCEGCSSFSGNESSGCPLPGCKFLCWPLYIEGICCPAAPQNWCFSDGLKCVWGCVKTPHSETAVW